MARVKVALVTAASKGVAALADELSHVTGQYLLVDGGMIRGLH